MTLRRIRSDIAFFCFSLFAVTAAFLLPAQEPASPPQAQVDQIARELSAKGPDSVWDGMLRLESLGKEAVPQLEKLLTDKDAKVRLAGAGALCGVGAPEKGAPVLEDLARKGDPRMLRDAALSALGRSAGGEQIQALNRLLAEPADPSFKVQVASSLWQASRSPKAVAALREALASQDGSARRAAALSLGEAGQLEDVRPMVEGIAKEPGLEGQLARSLLAQDRLARLLAAKADPKLLGKEKILEEIIDKARRHYIDEGRTSLDSLIEAAARGIAASLDKHTEYLSPQEVQDRQEMFRGEYFGIGAQVLKDEFGYIQIETSFFDGPAYKAGLRTGDRITKVGGESIQELTLTEAVKKLRGPINTPVQVEVLRAGWQQPQDLTILRGSISRDSIYSEMLPGKIGYLRMTQWGERTTDALDAGVKGMLKQGMKGLVIDLRGNGGGLLDAAVSISAKFLPRGSLIVYTEGRSKDYGQRVDYQAGGAYYHVQARGQDGQLRTYTEWLNPPEVTERGWDLPEHQTFPSDLPVAILTDKGSASASEIFAGAMKLHNRAELVGTVTYGKGSVQREVSLDSSKRVEGGKAEEARFKMTIAKYYLKDGTCIHGIGIKPDVEAAMPDVEGWKFAAVRSLQQKGAFKKYIDEQYPKNKEKFAKLAEAYQPDAAQFPGFDEWYKSLEITLPKDDAAKFLRLHIRERVASENGKPFALEYPLADDVALQRGVRELAKKLKVDLSALPEYKPYAAQFADAEKKEKEAATVEAKKQKTARQ